MNEWIALAGALLVGILAGGLFFGGLWYTVKKGITLKNPSLLFLGSFLLRTLATLALFYYVSAGSWQRLLVCTTGFLLARLIVLYLTRTPETTETTK